MPSGSQYKIKTRHRALTNCKHIVIITIKSFSSKALVVLVQTPKLMKIKLKVNILATLLICLSMLRSVCAGSSILASNTRGANYNNEQLSSASVTRLCPGTRGNVPAHCLEIFQPCLFMPLVFVYISMCSVAVFAQICSNVNWAAWTVLGRGIFEEFGNVEYCPTTEWNTCKVKYSCLLYHFSKC